MSSKGRTRSANFTLTEKDLLKELVREFSHTLNKKKVDKLAWREKHLVWDEICATFNDISTVGVFRSKESLKKLYDNHLRKDMSDESDDDEDDDDSEKTDHVDSSNEVTKSIDVEPETLRPTPQTTIDKLVSNRINEEANENDLRLQKAKLHLKILRMEFESSMTRHDLNVKRMRMEAQLQRQQLENLRFENEVKRATLDNLRLENGIKLRELEELKKLSSV